VELIPKIMRKYKPHWKGKPCKAPFCYGANSMRSLDIILRYRRQQYSWVLLNGFILTFDKKKPCNVIRTSKDATQKNYKLIRQALITNFRITFPHDLTSKPVSQDSSVSVVTEVHHERPIDGFPLHRLGLLWSLLILFGYWRPFLVW
jgi:hypothetical protein